MADSFSKKEREKKKRQRKKEKALRKQERKSEGSKPEEIMYVDFNGNFTPNKPEYLNDENEVELDDILISTPKKIVEELPDGMVSGVVKFFNHEKGYGFIENPDTRESFFVHINNCEDEIDDRDKVQFEVGESEKGKVALKVQKI